METLGAFTSESLGEAVDRYEGAGGTARVVVREVTKAMEFDAEEYEERVDSGVIETARDAIFAEGLAVNVADREEFDDWLAASEYAEDDLVLLGAENVDFVAWHPIAFAGVVIAATFHEERDAAVGIVRRNAFGRVYRAEFSDSDR